MEKDYLAEYVIGRIHELEKDLTDARRERDGYKHVLDEVQKCAETVFSHLEHNSLSDGSGDQYYKLIVWDKSNKPYAALKHLLWLLGVTDPGEENEEKGDEGDNE